MYQESDAMLGYSITLLPLSPTTQVCIAPATLPARLSYWESPNYRSRKPS